MSGRRTASSPSFSGEINLLPLDTVELNGETAAGKFEDRTIVLNKSITLAGKKAVAAVRPEHMFDLGIAANVGLQCHHLPGRRRHLFRRVDQVPFANTQRNQSCGFDANSLDVADSATIRCVAYMAGGPRLSAA